MTMKPSPLQYFLAHGLKVSMAVGSLIVAVLAAEACEAFSVWAVLAVLAAFSLGCVLGALFLSPLVCAVAARINGSPFREGDLVHILVGPYRDRVGRVYELWPSRNQARVEIDEKAKKDVTDVFAYNEICREFDA